MEKGFNNDGFMAYLHYQFPSVFTESASSFVRDLVENLIAYAHKHEHVSKDQFCEFLADLLPEVEMGEVAAFMEDCCLTKSYGLVEKQRVMEEQNICVEIKDGITRVFVDGNEL